ncbi:MAG: Gfo/Idh/MocA family oxidoreductase [Burkholderiales bacterium]|nr:Gfo/Idh/MocA family oxidoreductase [Burkholderiales bacterium]
MPTPAKPLRTAVVGLGWWGKYITQRLADSPRFEVTHGVDTAAGVAEFARRHHLALERSLEAVLANDAVDAVVIATPHSAHAAQVVAAAAAGKQVFCEKPLALTAADAERILAACDAAGIVLGIGHERRFEPAMEALARTIAAGTLGRILHLEANFSHDLFARMEAGNWRVGAQDAPAGAMTALGVHLTDLFISFAGRPRAVRARTARVRPEAAGVDHVSVWLDFASGATGAVTCLSATPFHGHLAVFGTDGWIEVRENANVDKRQPSDLVHCDAAGARKASSFAAIDTVRLNLESWARAVAGEAPYRYTREQLLDNVRVLDAVVRSADADGRLVEL